MKLSVGVIFDAVARRLLTSIDYRTVTLSVSILMVGLAVLIYLRRGAWPRLEIMIRSAEAFAIIVAGSVVGAVFLLTDPPAVELLSHEMRAFTGLTAMLVSLYVGVGTLRRMVGKGTRGKRGSNL
jgi:hypothetical protein